MNYLVKTKQEDLLYACLHSSCIRSLITFHEKRLIYHIMSLRGKVQDHQTSICSPWYQAKIFSIHIYESILSLFLRLFYQILELFPKLFFFFISFLGNLLPIRYCFFPDISMTIIEAVYIYPKIIIVIKANVDIIQMSLSLRSTLSNSYFILEVCLFFCCFVSMSCFNLDRACYDWVFCVPYLSCL